MDLIIKEKKGKLKKLGFGHIRLRIVKRTPGYYDHDSIVVFSDKKTTKKDADFCDKIYGRLQSCGVMRTDELEALKKVFGRYPKNSYYGVTMCGFYYVRRK